MSRLAVAARRAVRRVHRRLGDHPVALPLILRLTPLGTGRALSERTDVVVEGFPRSGNSYVVAALRLSQGPDLVVASHVHVPAQVIAAVRRRLPTVVLVRAPGPNAASTVVAVPHLDVARALRDWIEYHRRLLPHRAGFLAVDFEDAVGDVGRVVERVNDRFGPVLAPVDDTPALRARIVEQLRADHERVHAGAPHLAPWPDEDRAREGQRIVGAAIREGGVGALLEEAEALHALLLGR